METKTIKLIDYKPYPTNPNTHDDYQVGELAKSLDQFEQVKNIVVWNGHFIAGHGLAEAAKRSGITELEAVDVSDWPREKAEKFMIADNRTAELGVIDSEVMQMVLAGFDEPLDVPGVNQEWLDDIVFNPDDIEFKEYDEDIAGDVKYVECPSCGHKFPK